jgi:hypothetical protein
MLCALALALVAGAANGQSAPAAAVPLPPPPVDTGAFKVSPPPAAAPAGASRVLRVGVPDPRVVGEISPRELAVLSQALVTEVRKVEGISAVGMAEIRELLSLEYQRQMLGCQADEKCIAEIAGALGVDVLVSSQLAVVDGVSTFTLSRIEMRAMRTTASAQKRLTRRRGGEEVLGATGEMVAALFPDRPLRAGETRGVSPQVARCLNPPPLPTWAFYTTAGVAAAFASGGVAYGLSSNGSRDRYNRLARSPGVISGSELMGLRQQALDQGDRAALLFGVAGTLALAAGVEAFFTDWHDDRAAVRITPRGATVLVRF